MEDRMISGESPITVLPGVGKVRAAAYERLGIRTLEDLILHYPRAYEDRSRIRTLEEALPDEKTALVLTVGSEARTVRLRSHKSFLKFRAFDESGTCEITYFNQDYLKSTFSVGEVFRFFGKVEKKGKRFSMTSPVAERWVQGAPPPPLFAKYRLTDGLTQRQLSKDVEQAQHLLSSADEDFLPRDLLQKRQLCDRGYALREIHFPTDFGTLAIAKRRLVYEEFFLFSLGISIARSAQKRHSAIACRKTDLSALLSRLPYSLTDAQNRVIAEIRADMERPYAMTRMLTGDVGSGKTVCAAAAALFALQNGGQVAMMAPTEILARQHSADLSPLFDAMGYRTALLIGATSAGEKKRIKDGLLSGKIDFVIGTHALLSDGVEFSHPGLVITDEQHRFGALQRAKLSEKNRNAHLLVMSATPIPRSLALVLYGDMDLSGINEMPPGRQRVDTYSVDEGYRERLNGFIRKQVEAGGQVYVVCPAVEETEEESCDLPLSEIGLSAGLREEKPPLKAAVAYAKTLREVFPDFSVSFLHGKMKSKEKDAVMQEFVSGKTQILVSTTVIEVGVNVPNANLMIVENAERFGLSQLHQLRGRVGRGTRKSYCVLVTGAGCTEASKRRIGVMCSTYDGYRIAEKDLAERGPGDFLAVPGEESVRQSGGLTFRIADASADLDTLADATKDAGELLGKDSGLTDHPLLSQKVGELFSMNDGYIN